MRSAYFMVPSFGERCLRSNDERGAWMGTACHASCSLLRTGPHAGSAGSSLFGYRRPGDEWLSDLPLMAERVDDSTEPPPVLVAHGRGLRCAGGHRAVEDGVGVFDHEQCPAGRAVDRARTETFHGRRDRSDPERRVADTELRDDVIAVADTMKDACAKRCLVVGQRLARAVDPQLRLDARHRGSPT